jgi:hypothetical protein
MSTAERKSEMLRDQVISKIRWGARDQEVLDWLEQKHGITDSEAALLLADAHRAKRKAVRSKALVSLVCASFGILLAGCFIGLQFVGHVVVIGYGSILIIALGVLSLGVFFRSLILLVTGRAEGSVD